MSNTETGYITIPVEEYHVMHEATVQNRMVRDFIMHGRVLHLADVLLMLGFEEDAKKIMERG